MKAVVVRPAPGDARTMAKLAARGVDAERLELFAVRAVAWVAPDPSRYDALLLTSANALRFGGEGLASLGALPVVAVGEATAQAARDHGFAVAWVGDGDVAAVVARAEAMGLPRLLHLAGRDRVAAGSDAVTVYASDTVPISRDAVARLAGTVVLLHSARAARRVAALVDRERIDRGRIALVALSAAVATAAGAGWHRVAVAARPTDDALIATAIDQRAAPGDK